MTIFILCKFYVTEENLLLEHFRKRTKMKDIAKLTSKSERTLHRKRIEIEKKYNINLAYNEPISDYILKVL
jgi:hypothetical protein